MSVVILISTKNRWEFAGLVASQIHKQTLQPNGVVVVETSDNTTAANHWSEKLSAYNTTVKTLPSTTNLGESRNAAIEIGLNCYPDASYFALWDDDDYYLPHHLKSMVNLLESGKGAVAGSSKISTYYTKREKFVDFGPLMKTTTLEDGTVTSKHSCEPCLVFSREYAISHRFSTEGEKGYYGQCKPFLDDYSTIVLANPGTILHIAHSTNIFDKERLWACYIDNEGQSNCQHIAKIIDCNPYEHMRKNWIVDDEDFTEFTRLHGANFTEMGA